MNQAQHQRLAELQNRFCSYELIDALYGLGAVPADDVMGRYRAWWRRLRGVIGEHEGRIDRFWLETFFQRNKLLPRKWAAARLGMTERSFEDVLGRLDLEGVVTRTEVEPLSVLVNEPQIRIFHELFEATQMRIFTSHDDRCRRVHEAIRAAYDIEVEVLHDVTSQALGEAPLKIAYEFDAITGDPVSMAYEVWLDLKKPMSLRPDCCSLKLYVASRDELQPLAFSGVEPLEQRFGAVLGRLGAAA
ncbi:hypothetical protein [Sorangium sp. So ce131]|uniref:hypothetical protein n=1 Tax=Sorangium sp. So ce131 TaxID=3133282 RepID=UPI003F6310A2